MQVSTGAVVITGIEKEDRLYLSGFASEAYETLRINRLLYRLEKQIEMLNFYQMCSVAQGLASESSTD